MKTFQEWLELPENDHMRVDYEKADLATQINFRLFYLGGALATLDEAELPFPVRDTWGL